MKKKMASESIKLRLKKLLNLENIIFLILVLLGSVLYFKVPMFIMPDSAEYYRYLLIFNGINPLSSWDVTRGFSFPCVLFLITKLFGDSQAGFLIGSYLFYLLYIIITFWLYKRIKKEINNKVAKVFVTVLYYILILLNPICFGYFHALYTEFVAIPLGIISCVVSYKFLNYKFDLKNLKTYLFGVFYILLFIFCWFLKQPYFTIAFFPLIIVIFLAIFKHKSWKDFIYRFSTLVLSGVLLLFSIGMWKNFLINNGVDYNNGRNNENFLRKAFFLGIRDFRFDEIEENYLLDNVLNDPLISEEDKMAIQSRNDQKYVIFSLYDNEENLIDKMIMYYDGDNYSSKDSLKFLIKAFLKHPKFVIDSYVSGYLATIDIYVSMRDGNGDYFPHKEFDADFNHENEIVGLAYLTLDENFLWLYSFPNLVEVSKGLHRDVNINLNIKDFVLGFSQIHFWGFKIAFLLLPFVLLFAMVMYIFRKHHDFKYEMAVILLGLAFLHIMFHVFMGAIIDRYVFIVFGEIILGYMLLFIRLPKTEVFLENKKVRKEINKGKSIFVIPAYNESKHIAEVIEDIQKNMPESDIVVINDCSKDNTRDIVESMENVVCLNLPYNMGYAMAVQTGIKYACDNNYDYVIQFDADGQHLAVEAQKLMKKIQESDANIVIGSRFIKQTDYNHPFFRKIGTKLFQIIIKVFCDKKITDPTSGFQIIDRNVIERYAMMGKYPEFPDANLIIEMLLAGYSIEEVSVKMKINDEGKSMHSGIIKPIKYMINVTYTILFILLRGRGK